MEPRQRLRILFYALTTQGLRYAAGLFLRFGTILPWKTP